MYIEEKYSLLEQFIGFFIFMLIFFCIFNFITGDNTKKSEIKTVHLKSLFYSSQTSGNFTLGNRAF